MEKFNYNNLKNYFRSFKYFIGAGVMYGMTVSYTLEAQKSNNFNMGIGISLAIVSFVFTVPFINSMIQTLFDHIRVSEEEIIFFSKFRTTKIKWQRVAFFRRIASKGVLQGSIHYYELGNNELRMIFDSTISREADLIKFAQRKLGHIKQKAMSQEGNIKSQKGGSKYFDPNMQFKFKK